MRNLDESNFQDFEYDHSLDCKEVQHSVGTLFEGMCFIKKTRSTTCFVVVLCEQMTKLKDINIEPNKASFHF